jgi:hypothetical protein
MGTISQVLSTIFVTLLVACAFIMWYGKQGREAEEKKQKDGPSGNDIGEAVMVMFKLYTLDGSVIEHLPMYFEVDSVENLRAQINSWVCRVYVTGYFKNRGDTDDVECWSPHQIGNIVWNVQSWGKLKEKK